MSEISIIIPVYNAEKYLERCLNALLKQTFTDIEILCINDGSKDKSLDILNKYSNKDTRIKIFTQENSGPAKARNTGLKNATGKYLMFCDTDDWYEDNMCEEMYKTIENTNCDFVVCNKKIIDIGYKTDPKITNSDFPYKGLLNLTPEIKEKFNAYLCNKILKNKIVQKYKY